MFGSVSHLGWT